MIYREVKKLFPGRVQNQPAHARHAQKPCQLLHPRPLPCGSSLLVLIQQLKRTLRGALWWLVNELNFN